MSRWSPHHSAMLSFLLDDVTGTEEAVAIRQDYCRIRDFLTPVNSYTGSKAEGLDLPGSDDDFMSDFNNICSMKVVQSLLEMSDTSSCNVFLLCTENVNPGFAFLCPVNQIDNPFLTSALQCINGVQYLSSDMMMNNAMLVYNCFPDDINDMTRKRQGPSIEIRFMFQDQSEEGSDHVISIHCQFWPNDASEWIRRPRHHEWPTSHDISTIVDFGCHLVPVGHPNSETKTLEWRISFSVAERTLVWSFNHVQMQCYAVMKIILKEFIKKRCSSQNQILCSYFIKTFLFWKYEETDLNFWSTSIFTECINYLLTEFYKCIHDGVLRHYFLPQFNLLSVKLTKEARSELLEVFDIIIQCDISILKECNTLQTVWSKFLIANDNQMNIIHNEKKNILIKNDEVMKKVFTELCDILFYGSNPVTNHILSNVLNKLNMNIPLIRNVISELLPTFLPYFMTKNLTSDEKLNIIVTLQCKTSLKDLMVKQLHVQKHIESSMLDRSNKILYNLQQTIRDHKTLCDLSMNKLWSAIVLMKRFDYTQALSIINQMLSSVPPYALYKSWSDSCESKRRYVDTFLNSSCTVMERAKHAWITDIIFYKYMTEVLPLAIQIELNHIPDLIYGINIPLSPFTCAYYLMFLCYYELGQYDNRDRALQELIVVVNNSEQCGIRRHHSYNIAGHCLLMTGEKDIAHDMFYKSIQFARWDPEWDRYNAAVWYMRKFYV